jgi:hypothetical protein
MCNHFIKILSHKRRTKLNKTDRKLVLVNAHFRAYFEQLNSQLKLDLITTQ